MNRRRRDIDDVEESIFDHAEAQRRQRAREKMIEENARRDEQESAAEAKRQARMAAERAKTNEAFVLREYRAAGVAPPHVDADGRPTCSLSLLLRVGWKIEDLGRGEKALIAPPPAPKWEGHRDKDSPEATRPKKGKR